MASTVYGEQQNISVGGNTAGATSAGPGSLFLAGGPNVTLSGATAAGVASISVSVAAQTVQTQNVVVMSASNTLYTSGTVVISGFGDITVNTNGQTIRISGSQSTSPAAISAGTTQATNGTVVFSNLNGLAFGMNAGTITGSYTVPTQTVQTQGFINSVSVVGNTAGATSAGSGSLVFAGGPNITISGSTAAGGMTLSISGGAGGGGAADGVNILAAGTQTANTTGTVLFNDANGISFGMANSSVITASHNALTSQSNQAVSGSNGSFTFQTVTFGNLNGISFYTSNGSLVGSHNALTSQSNHVLSGSNGSFTFQTATFGNLNGVSFYSSNGSLVASHNGITSQSVQTQGFLNTISVGGNTAGATSQGSGSIVLAGGPNITLSGSTAAGGMTLSISAGAGGGGGTAATAYAVSNTTQSSSGTFALSSLQFAGAGIVSVGVSNGSVVISAPSGGGAGDGYQALVAGTQTGGSTGSMSFANSNGVTFGMSNNSVITASVAAPVASYYPLFQNSLAYQALNSGAFDATNTTASFYVMPMALPMGLVVSQQRIQQSYATAIGTGSATNGHSLGIYSLNGSTMSYVTGWQNVLFISQNSVTAQTLRVFYGTNSAATQISLNGNVSASHSGIRNLILGDSATTSFSAGQYYAVMGGTRQTVGANIIGGLSIAHLSEGGGTFIPDIGVNSASTNQFIPFYGAFSVTRASTATDDKWAVNMLPATFHSSAITANASAQARSIFIMMANTNRTN